MHTYHLPAEHAATCTLGVEQPHAYLTQPALSLPLPSFSRDLRAPARCLHVERARAATAAERLRLHLHFHPPATFVRRVQPTVTNARAEHHLRSTSSGAYGRTRAV